MVDIKVYKQDEKLQEIYEEIVEGLDEIIKEYQLSYFDLLGVLECIKIDIYKNNMEEEE